MPSRCRFEALSRRSQFAHWPAAMSDGAKSRQKEIKDRKQWRTISRRVARALDDALTLPRAHARGRKVLSTSPKIGDILFDAM